MKRKLTLTLAIVLALAGSAMLWLYARGADSRALVNAQPAAVWVANDLVPSGTTIRAAIDKGLISITKVTKKAIPDGALPQDITDNDKQVALTDIAPGEYVLAARFGKTPMAKKAIDIPEGMIAVSVALDEAERVGKFITPGSHIVIYDTYGIKSLATNEQAKQFNSLDIKGTSVLLEDVLVIAMGETPLTTGAGAEKSDKQAEASAGDTLLVTVAVAPADSVRLVHGIKTGSLYAGLRGANVELNRNDTVTDLNLFPPTKIGAPQ